MTIRRLLSATMLAMLLATSLSLGAGAGAGQGPKRSKPPVCTIEVKRSSQGAEGLWILSANTWLTIDGKRDGPVGVGYQYYGKPSEVDMRADIIASGVSVCVKNLQFLGKTLANGLAIRYIPLKNG